MRDVALGDGGDHGIAMGDGLVAGQGDGAGDRRSGRDALLHGIWKVFNILTAFAVERVPEAVLRDPPQFRLREPELLAPPGGTRR